MKGPVVKPPAKSSISCETKVGYSGLYPVGSWKAPKMETAQPLLGGRLSTLQLKTKQPKALVLWSGACCLSSPWKEHFILLHAGFLKPIQVGSSWPRWAHPHAWGSSSKLQPGNTNISSPPDTGERSAERLLGLLQGWLCPPQILLFSYKIMWETTYLGNLCEFIKYFEQSWPALGGLDRVNQWAFLIIMKCLLVCLSLLWNPLKYFLIRKDFPSFNNCSQREATFSDPVLGNDHLKN